MAAKQGKGNPFPASPSTMGGKAVSAYAKTMNGKPAAKPMPGKGKKVGTPKPVSK